MLFSKDIILGLYQLKAKAFELLQDFTWTSLWQCSLTSKLNEYTNLLEILLKC